MAKLTEITLSCVYSNPLSKLVQHTSKGILQHNYKPMCIKYFEQMSYRQNLIFFLGSKYCIYISYVLSWIAYVQFVRMRDLTNLTLTMVSNFLLNCWFCSKLQRDQAALPTTRDLIYCVWSSWCYGTFRLL